MPPQQPLESLIHSLDQTERRYFTLQAKRHTTDGKNIYLQLFQAIASQNPSDDEQLKKIVPPDQLASQKHYLYQMLLKAMRGYQTGKGVEVQMREMIQDISFLEGKSMLAPCQKLLKKAKKLAHDYERFQDLLLLLDVERRLVKLTQREGLDVELYRIASERKSAIHRLDVQCQYVELYDHLFIVLRQQVRLQRESTIHSIREVLASPLLVGIELATSFQAKSYYYLCSAYCRQLLGDFQAAFLLHKANVEHWEIHPQWAKEEPYQYQRALSNYLGGCEKIQCWEVFPATLAKMKDLSCNTKQEQAEHFSNYYFYAFFYDMNAWQFEQAVKMAPALQKGLEEYGAIIPDSRRLTFIYNLMVMFFFLQKPKESLHWLQMLLHGERTEVRQDLQSSARLFLLILHYQLDNLDLYDHLFPSVLRYLGHRGLNTFEQRLVDFLKGLYRDGSKAWPHAAATDLAEEFEALTRAFSDAHFPGIREAIIWLRAKSSGKTMIEIGRVGGTSTA